MKTIFKKYLIITLAVLMLTQAITAIKINGSSIDILKSTILLTFIYYIFRPLVSLIALPINILTLNLFSWIINFIVFYIWTIFTHNLEINNWQFLGFSSGFINLSPVNLYSWQVLILSSIILTIFIKIFEWIIK